VYTHFAGDMNRDHGLTAEAVEIACRLLPGQSVSALYAFETVSSTEWGIGDTGFMPQLFIDVVDELELKLKALRCYDSEMRPFPHARSYEAVEALARLRGAQSGVGAAEAFMVRRELRR
jgi:LmbE family N-acetylglucosaminyl deacetylase